MAGYICSLNCLLLSGSWVEPRVEPAVLTQSSNPSNYIKAISLLRLFFSCAFLRAVLCDFLANFLAPNFWCRLIGVADFFECYRLLRAPDFEIFGTSTWRVT
jgi:hypothetical protein